MISLLQNVFWVIVALLGFSLLVMVHELGHCIAAKRGGIQVNEFWIGMGPKLLSRKWGETTYCLCLLPIGGACVMEGEDADSENPRAFNNAGWLRRFIVLAAGVFMNFVTGLLILVCLLVPVKEVVAPVIGGFYEEASALTESGLAVGDEILKIDGYHILTGADVSEGLRRGAADGKFDFVVRRNGEKLTFSGIAMQPNVDLGDGRTGYGFQLSIEELTIFGRLEYAFKTALNDARLVWHSLGDLITGAVGIDQLSGPVGVVAVTAETAKMGMRAFWSLMAFISINLAVMNLLPIPGLDGGRILFLLIEGIRRKPLDARLEGYINVAGLCALFALILFVTGQDILRLLA